ncbi:MAG: hypothetical protein ABSE05_06890 [Syntrophales bacterium]|jgi:hypothetical protein
MPLDRNTIIRILEERGANLPCHRCGKDEFTVFDKYSFLSLQDEKIGALILGGQQISVFLVGCNNCGAITAHASGVLELPAGPKEGEDGSK